MHRPALFCHRKQFGGLRGVAGWVRESAEHKKNPKP